MGSTADLHLVLSRELDTEELSLEHDTMVVTPEAARRIREALEKSREGATIIDFPAHARS